MDANRSFNSSRTIGTIKLIVIVRIVAPHAASSFAERSRPECLAKKISLRTRPTDDVDGVRLTCARRRARECVRSMENIFFDAIRGR